MTARTDTQSNCRDPGFEFLDEGSIGARTLILEFNLSLAIAAIEFGEKKRNQFHSYKERTTNCERKIELEDKGPRSL